MFGFERNLTADIRSVLKERGMEVAGLMIEPANNYRVDYIIVYDGKRKVFTEENLRKLTNEYSR